MFQPHATLSTQARRAANSSAMGAAHRPYRQKTKKASTTQGHGGFLAK